MMTGLDDILKSPQWIGNIQNFSELKNELVKTLVGVSKSVSGESMLTEIAKRMEQYHKMHFIDPSLPAINAMPKRMEQYHKMFLIDPSLPAINAIQQSLNFQAKFTIPQATIDAIASINRQNEQFLGGVKQLAEALKIQFTKIAQINNLNFALSGISGQIAAIAAQQRDWTIIDDFEEVTKEAVSLNQRIFDENGITKEDLNELKEFFQRIELKLEKIDADANSKFWKFLALLSFILAVSGEVRNWLPKPEYATKQEVETVIKEQFRIYEKKLKEGKEFRVTSRVCKVMSKPRTKSLVIENLPIDFEVIVIQIHHKWVYVTYFDPKNNLPQTGWILKKYLNKPE